jgi:predicted secreted hydrolase
LYGVFALCAPLLRPHPPNQPPNPTQYTIAIGANSERTEHHDMTFEAAGDWHSVRTYQTFPTEFHLVVPSAGIDLRMKASIADSEFITAISEPSFWEGRIEVAGTYGGKPGA